MKIHIPILWVGLLLFTAANAVAQVPLFHPVESHTAATAVTVSSAATPEDRTRRVVTVNTNSLRSMQTGDEATVDTPDGTTYVLTYERTETGYGGGSVWVGHVRDYGRDYPVLISTYAGQVNGSIATPGGKLRLVGTEQNSVLTDMQVTGEQIFTPAADDIVLPPRATGLARNASIPDDVSAANASSSAQIDLLMLFTAELQTQLGGYSATVARLNLLVATANNVYVKSGINATLNVVYAQAVNYAYDNATDPVALGSMQSDSTVATLRNLYGADAVALLRPFHASGGVCGLSYQTADFTYSGYAFSVVEDGTDGNFYCDITTLTHEIGHLMGAAHDVATSVQTAAQNGQSCTANPSHACYDGYPSYNRGYCNGNAGTIMSYSTAANGCSPLVQYFSNPALNTCNGGSCGVPIGTSYMAANTTVTGADSVTAINVNAPQMAAWRAPPSKFTSLNPARVLDTRAGESTIDGLFAGSGPLAANGQLDLTIAGRGGVPLIRTGAVVLNLTVVNPTSGGYVTAWPTGAGRPFASNINFTPGQTIPNLVVAQLGSNGRVSLYNSNGNTDLIADVAGWFPTASAFVPMNPSRIVDTRSSTALPPGAELDVPVAGQGGVPASGVSAVVLNLTATGPTSAGYVTAWPAGSARPLTSNLNFAPGQTVANLAVVKLGANGNIALFNSNGNTNLIADVAGWFPTASELTALVPARLLETRPGSTTIDGQYAGGGMIGAGAELDLTVTGRGGVPASGVGSVVLNVTAITPTADGYVTVWPKGSSRPLASNLNLTAGGVVQNLVFAQVGTNGQVAIYNSNGATHMVADVVGWFATSP